jgi:hypothetical protein
MNKVIAGHLKSETIVRLLQGYLLLSVTQDNSYFYIYIY